MTTGMKYVAPVQCMPWCSNGDGHPREISHLDQNCYSDGNYLYLPLNDRQKGLAGDDIYAQIGVAAKREIDLLPCVHIHLLSADPDVDVGVKFTAAEARWLAAQLLEAAELISGKSP
jgi:hypothetical protein